jgi:hypothetical protein
MSGRGTVAMRVAFGPRFLRRSPWAVSVTDVVLAIVRPK